MNEIEIRITKKKLRNNYLNLSGREISRELMLRLGGIGGTGASGNDSAWRMDDAAGAL